MGIKFTRVMAKQRRFSAYRNSSGPAYTRTSRFRAKSYIRMNKNTRIVRWHMGNDKADFEYVYYLVAKDQIQIRDLAIESFRQCSNRVLEKNLGNDNYYFHIRMYPHHILRENALASGAGADRLSTGMSHCFGKAVGVASRVKPGQKILEVRVNKDGLEFGKRAASLARTKLPGTYAVVLEKIEKPVKAKVEKAVKTEKPVEVKTEKPVEAEKPAEVEAEKPVEVKTEA